MDLASRTDQAADFGTVIPAKAGIHPEVAKRAAAVMAGASGWIPAFAGTTRVVGLGTTSSFYMCGATPTLDPLPFGHSPQGLSRSNRATGALCPCGSLQSPSRGREAMGLALVIQYCRQIRWLCGGNGCGIPSPPP